jgi:hypothetical protein
MLVMADEEKPGRIRQFRQAFTLTRQADSRLIPWMAGVAGGVLVVAVVLGVVFDRLILFPALGLLIGLYAALIIFGRRAQKAQFTMIEGKPGAAAAILQNIRGPWRVTPAVAFTRKQDLVHLVVGRPGIVLVGEGAPARVKSLLKQEARTYARAAGDVPVHEISVGTGTGQVPLPKLRATLLKLPRKIKPREVGPLDTKLSALGGQDLPIPKGPMPRSIRRGKMR